MAISANWPDSVDDIIGGDQAVVLGHVTPARGVVLTPLTNFGIRDRRSGSMTPLNSSVGMWRKLQRLRESPRVAIAYHTRTHGFSERPEYVLVQGRASLSSVHDTGWLQNHREAWERFAGTRDVGTLWEWWLRPYHRRVGIDLDVERITVWPTLDCEGPPSVYGAPAADLSLAPQSRPKGGTAPRVNHARAARRISLRPNRLLGWVGSDGFPQIVPVDIGGVDEDGFVVRSTVDLPMGGRRAGLAAHSFARYTHGQHQHKYTGWLSVNGPRAVYAPHTEAGYFLPPSRTAYRIGAGYVTRRGLREARRAGFLDGERD